MKKFLPDIPFFTIHLQKELGREPFMTHFQNNLGREVKVWDASDGNEVARKGWPRKHPFEPETSIGALGCLDSHIRLLEYQIQNAIPILGIFEDDAEIVSPLEDLETFYTNAGDDWDILFLGANEWVEIKYMDPKTGADNYNCAFIQRFWGTHAFLIKERAAQLVIQDHLEILKNGYAYPADWLYAYSIQKHKLKALGPFNAKQYIRQKPGLISSINGKVRS